MQAQYGTRQTKKKIGNLEKVQKRVARFVFNTYTDRTPGCVTKMVQSLKWEKLEERRKTHRLCMLYNIKNGLIDIDSHQYIQSNDNRTRGKDRLYQERTSSKAFGNLFFPRTIRDWNQLRPTQQRDSGAPLRRVLTATRPAPTCISFLPVNSRKKATFITLLLTFVTLLFCPLHQSGKDLSLLLKLSKVGALDNSRWQVIPVVNHSI